MRRFQTGQAIVLADDNFDWKFWRLQESRNLIMPIRGLVYHLREYCDCPPPLSIYLVEIRNRRVWFSDDIPREAAFGEFRFEPAPR